MILVRWVLINELELCSCWFSWLLPLFQSIKRRVWGFTEDPHYLSLTWNQFPTICPFSLCSAQHGNHFPASCLVPVSLHCCRMLAMCKHVGSWAQTHKLLEELDIKYLRFYGLKVSVTTAQLCSGDIKAVKRPQVNVAISCSTLFTKADG
jgi:hypothetical protein